MFYLLENEVGIDWDVLPDRPDGLISIPNANAGTKKLVGQPRRSILMGGLVYQDRELPIRLQRVKVKDQSPVWVFSPSTVENIGLMYKVYGPSQLAQLLPKWTQFTIFNMPLWKWLVFLIITAISYLVARLGYGLARRLSRRANDERTTAIMNSTATPIAFLFGIGIFLLISSLSQAYIGPVSSYFNGILWVAIVVAFTWLLMRVIHYFSNYLAKKHTAEHQEDDEKVNRTYLTYISVAHRALVFIVVVVGFAVILTQFRPMKALGVSLLSSVGFISVIVGIAAQSTIGNIIAGIQVAITRPVRIGDAVLYEGSYGWVEDITYTYLVIRTWDERRKIVPLKYFISNPLENWSMKNRSVVRAIYLYTDYRIDVQKIRDKYQELYEEAEDWDDQTGPTVQVTAIKEETMEIRLVCSSADSSTSWDLHCRLREEMMRYVTELEDGSHLSQRRVKVLNNQQKAEANGVSNGKESSYQ